MLPIMITAILVLLGILIVEYFSLAETFTDTSGAEDLSGASTDTLLKTLIDKFNEAISSSSRSTSRGGRSTASSSEEEEDTTSTDAKEFKNSSDILSSIQQTIRNEFRQNHTFDDSLLAPCSDNTVSACTLQGAEYSSEC
jgi:hypothetical protein